MHKASETFAYNLKAIKLGMTKKELEDFNSCR